MSATHHLPAPAAPKPDSIPTAGPSMKIQKYAPRIVALALLVIVLFVLIRR